MSELAWHVAAAAEQKLSPDHMSPSVPLDQVAATAGLAVWVTHTRQAETGMPYDSRSAWRAAMLSPDAARSRPAL